ncbi:CHC2 zinc finger domain-containing protein [Gemmatimonadota bacterium]
MLSEHLRLEIAVAHTRGRALEPGEPVPGCGCPECTGLGVDHPARSWRTRRKKRSESWERTVEDARSRPLLDVARGLGMEPKKAGREWRCSCPFHEDRTPSLYLNPDKNLWTCHSCGRGGDGIRLVQEVKRLGFSETVKELAGVPGP